MKSTAANRPADIPGKTALKVNPDWARLPLFDRLSWRRVRFGQVVDNLNDTCDPNEERIERFIGLEHLEPGSLHVRTWGNVADGTTFTRRCRPGQVLFGKRRAYQRKVAVAGFDAVVSGDIYVLAPKIARLLPELLPFLCMSELFFKFAVETSAGSLSPRTNWSHLAQFEFALPPLAQQRRIAEILWAIDNTENAMSFLTGSANYLFSAELENELDHLYEGPSTKLEEILKSGPESGCSAVPSAIEAGHYVLSLSAVSKSGYIPGNLKPVTPSSEMLKCRLSPGDLLISRSNTQELVGLVGIFGENRDDVSFPDTMMRLPVDESKVSKRFLEAVLLSRRGRLHMMQSAAGTSGSMKKINRRTLGTCLVPVPSLAIQERLLTKLSTTRHSVIMGKSSKTAIRNFKSSFLNALFGIQP